MRTKPVSWRVRAAVVWTTAIPLWFTGAALPAGEGTAIVPAKGWRFSVYAENLPAVDNLAIGPDGLVYATLELKQGQGRLVRVLPDGRHETVVARLDRPDGLFAHGKYLYVTEEVSQGRVLEVDPASGATRTLVRLNNPEGVAMLPDGDLVLSEDSVNGRLVQLRANGTVETLLGGLNRPEGLAVARDGTIYIAETATGRVLVYKDGIVRSLIDDLDEPDQVKLAPNGSLWITEDSPRGRLLKLKDGALYVILSGLHSPQGIAFQSHGSMLLAEQGRARILRVSREEGP